MGIDINSVLQIGLNADFSPVNLENEADIPNRAEKPAEAKIEPAGRLQRTIDINKRLREQSTRIIREYSTNRRKAGELRKELAKGTKAGDDLQGLYLKAVECIYLMTGDEAFYKSIVEYLKG